MRFSFTLFLLCIHILTSTQLDPSSNIDFDIDNRVTTSHGPKSLKFRPSRAVLQNHVKYANYSPSTSPHLVYSGGPLTLDSIIIPIFIGKYVADMDGIIQFYKDIQNSSYYKAVKEYEAGPYKLYSNGSFGGYHIESENAIINSIDVSDTDVQVYLKSLVKKGVISPTSNTMYPVHFQPGVTITRLTAKSCVEFCGYHDAVDVRKENGYMTPFIYYFIIPDLSKSSNCACCCGGGGKYTALERVTAVSSHEVVETATDPVPYYGNLGWYEFNLRQENVDICPSVTYIQTDSGGVYLVEHFWSNLIGKCIAPGDVPPPATACVHSVCEAGPPLRLGCADECANLVMQHDSYCANSAWDSFCLSDVKKLCGIDCSTFIPTTLSTTTSPSILLNNVIFNTTKTPNEISTKKYSAMFLNLSTSTRVATNSYLSTIIPTFTKNTNKLEFIPQSTPTITKSKSKTSATEQSVSQKFKSTSRQINKATTTILKTTSIITSKTKKITLLTSTASRAKSISSNQKSVKTATTKQSSMRTTNSTSRKSSTIKVTKKSSAIKGTRKPSTVKIATFKVTTKSAMKATKKG